MDLRVDVRGGGYMWWILPRKGVFVYVFGRKWWRRRKNKEGRGKDVSDGNTGNSDDKDDFDNDDNDKWKRKAEN